MTRIAVIGGGRIGEALIAGLRDAGTPAQDIVVVEAVEERAAELGRRYAILATTLDIACEGADVVVVAVKPGDVPAVAQRIGDAVSDSVHECVVVSLAAGVPTAAIEGRLSAGSPVVRVMPNTAMLVGQGTSAICAGRYARDEDVRAVVSMMSTVGSTVVVAESQMDAVTAVSGSGPAYFFLLAEALVDAAVENGLPRPIATELVVGTARGAGAMLAADDAPSPTELRGDVTSPGGTTAAALRRLEAASLRAGVADAVEAAVRRSAELASASLDALGDGDHEDR